MKLEALESRRLLAFDLSSLNGTNGFTLEGIDGGIDGGDFSGHAVGGAGDINGDGLDDVIIGAFGADRNGVVDYSGEAYVVFGSTSSFPANFALSSLNGTNGLRSPRLILPPFLASYVEFRFDEFRPDGVGTAIGCPNCGASPS